MPFRRGQWGGGGRREQFNFQQERYKSFDSISFIHNDILLEWKTYFRDRETAWHSLIRIFSNKMNIHSRCMHLAQWSVQKPGGTPLSDFQNFTFLDQDPILWQIVWLVNGGWLPKCLTLNIKYHLSIVIGLMMIWLIARRDDNPFVHWLSVAEWLS